jgi:hypothetical protein
MYSLRRSGGEAADHRLADANRTLLPGERRPGKWAVLGPSRKAHLPFRPQARTTSSRTKEWGCLPAWSGRWPPFLKACGLARLHSHCRRAGPTVESVRLKAPRLACRASCVDRLLIFRRHQLERVLQVYVRHYNRHRTHRALELRPPNADAEAASPPPPTFEARHVRRRDLLGGLLQRCDPDAGTPSTRVARRLAAHSQQGPDQLVDQQHLPAGCSVD